MELPSQAHRGYNIECEHTLRRQTLCFHCLHFRKSHGAVNVADCKRSLFRALLLGRLLQCTYISKSVHPLVGGRVGPCDRSEFFRGSSLEARHAVDDRPRCRRIFAALLFFVYSSGRENALVAGRTDNVGGAYTYLSIIAHAVGFRILSARRSSMNRSARTTTSTEITIFVYFASKTEHGVEEKAPHHNIHHRIGRNLLCVYGPLGTWAHTTTAQPLYIFQNPPPQILANPFPHKYIFPGHCLR